MSDYYSKDIRQLLPWWVKSFCWLFMVTGVLSIIAVILQFFDFAPALSLYGFEVEEGKSLNTIIIVFSFLLNGIVAYGLWFNKKKSILLGQISSIWGLILCLLSMFLSVWTNSDFTFRAEIIFLILFFIKLKQIKVKYIEGNSDISNT